MPFQYARDDGRRRIRLTAIDPLTHGDVAMALDRQVAEGAWQYGTLVDARQATTFGSLDSRQDSDYVHALTLRHGPCGPTATVTREAVARAQTFAIRSAEQARPVQVFYDIDEADHWLDAQLSNA